MWPGGRRPSHAGPHGGPPAFQPAGPWQAGYPPPPVPMYGAPAAPPKQLPVEPVAVLSRPHVSLPPVSVQQPLLMSTFSYDENKMLHLDDSAKRWYRVPPTKETSAQGADLNYGFERFQDKPHIPDPLDSVLYTLMYRPSAQRPSKEPVMRAPQVPVEALESEVLRAQIITWRGIMTKLCTAWSCHVQAPPMFREGFELNVMMVRDPTLTAAGRYPDYRGSAADGAAGDGDANPTQQIKAGSPLYLLWYAFSFNVQDTVLSPTARAIGQAMRRPRCQMRRVCRDGAAT